MSFDEYIVAQEEYFCWTCGQLRLNATGLTAKKCRHCGGTDLTIGNPGELNKEELKRKFREKKGR